MTKDQVSKDIKEDAKSNNSVVLLRANSISYNKDPKPAIIVFAELSYNHPVEESPFKNRYFHTRNLSLEKSNENSFSKVLAEESKTQFGFYKQPESSMRNGGIFHRKFSS